MRCVQQQKNQMRLQLADHPALIWWCAAAWARGAEATEQIQRLDTNDRNQDGQNDFKKNITKLRRHRPQIAFSEAKQAGRQDGSDKFTSSQEGKSGRETSLGDKAAATNSRPSRDFGNQEPSHWEVRTPIASSYLGNKKLVTKSMSFLKISSTGQPGSHRTAKDPSPGRNKDSSSSLQTLVVYISFFWKSVRGFCAFSKRTWPLSQCLHSGLGVKPRWLSSGNVHLEQLCCRMSTQSTWLESRISPNPTEHIFNTNRNTHVEKNE